MKKLLAALLALAMLLGACAWAEGGQLTLRNIRIDQDAPASTIDLSGLELVLNTAFTGESPDGGLRLTCSANGRALATLVLAMFGDALLAGYGSGGQADTLYTLGGFTGDTIRGAESAAAGYLQRAGDALAAPDASFFEEISLLVPAEWTSDGGAVEYEGDTCQCTTFEAPAELLEQTVRKIADALAANPQFDLFMGRIGGADAFRSAVEDLAGSARFSGALYDGESADYIDLTLNVEAGGAPLQLDADVRFESIERGDLLSVLLSLTGGDTGIRLSFDFEGVETDDEDWLWQMDAADATKLDAVFAGEEDPQPLLEKLQGDVATIAGALTAGVANVIFTNQLNAMTAGAES